MRFLRRFWPRPDASHRALQEAHIKTTRLLVELQRDHEKLINDFETLAREVKLLRETEAQSIQRGLEADRKVALAEVMQVKAEDMVAAAKEQIADAARQLLDQIALNADLVQGKFDTTLDIGRHSELIDPFKIQVLTQMRTENLIVGPHLIPALMQTFAFNVAQHLVRKLSNEGALSVSREAREVVKSLPPFIPQDPVTMKLHGTVTQDLRLLDREPEQRTCRTCGATFLSRTDEAHCPAHR